MQPFITVIPLSIDGSVPPGALNHIQSTLIDPNAPTYNNIFAGLALHHVGFLISAITQIIADSNSYRDAEKNFDLIVPYLPRATDQQVVELLNINSAMIAAWLVVIEYKLHID